MSGLAAPRCMKSSGRTRQNCSQLMHHRAHLLTASDNNFTVTHGLRAKSASLRRFLCSWYKITIQSIRRATWCRPVRPPARLRALPLSAGAFSDTPCIPLVWGITSLCFCSLFLFLFLLLFSVPVSASDTEKKKRSASTHCTHSTHSTHCTHHEARPDPCIEAQKNRGGSPSVFSVSAQMVSTP